MFHLPITDTRKLDRDETVTVDESAQSSYYAQTGRMSLPQQALCSEIEAIIYFQPLSFFD